MVTVNLAGTFRRLGTHRWPLACPLRASNLTTDGERSIPKAASPFSTNKASASSDGATYLVIKLDGTAVVNLKAETRKSRGADILNMTVRPSFSKPCQTQILDYFHHSEMACSPSSTAKEGAVTAAVQPDQGAFETLRGAKVSSTHQIYPYCPGGNLESISVQSVHLCYSFQL